MAHERTCIICGNEYRYCGRCGEFNPTEVWRYKFCSTNCLDIYNIMPKYNGGFDKNELKKEMETKDLSRLQYFNPTFKKAVDDIMSTTPIVEEEIIPVVEEVVVPTFEKKKKKNKSFVNDVVEIEPVEPDDLASLQEEIIPPVEEL